MHFKKINIVNFVFVLIVLSFFSCSKEVEKDSYRYDIADFDSLSVQSVFQIHLIQDSVNYVKISAFEKNVPNIETDVKDKTLFLKDKTSPTWTRPQKNTPVLYVHLKNLKQIYLFASGSLVSDNELQGESLCLITKARYNDIELNLRYQSFCYWNNHPNGGLLNLKGVVQSLTVWNSSLNTLDARNLKAKYVMIDTQSKADSYASCTEELHTNIRSIGNIYIFGNPISIDTLKTGSGNLFFK